MASTIEKKPVAVKKSATKKPATKKANASKPAVGKATTTASKPKAVKKAASKKAPAKKASKTALTKISAAERYRMIETAAYFIAERNGFKGNSADNWVAAEAQIAKMLAK
jgi:Protein of unknown function (DUF2934)